MKRKRASVWVLVSLILSLVMTMTACKSTLDNKTTNDAYVLHKDDFPIYFSGRIENWALDAEVMDSKLSNVSMTISETAVNGDRFSCNIQISLESGAVDLPVYGTLKSSFRSQDGMNSIIVEVDGKINDYAVRLFEIVNDTQ